jgi:hypothetical protein
VLAEEADTVEGTSPAPAAAKSAGHPELSTANQSNSTPSISEVIELKS